MSWKLKPQFGYCNQPVLDLTCNIQEYVVILS